MTGTTKKAIFFAVAVLLIVAGSAKDIQFLREIDSNIAFAGDAMIVKFNEDSTDTTTTDEDNNLGRGIGCF